MRSNRLSYRALKKRRKDTYCFLNSISLDRFFEKNADFGLKLLVRRLGQQFVDDVLHDLFALHADLFVH